jgi:hypothetical protein
MMTHIAHVSLCVCIVAIVMHDINIKQTSFRIRADINLTRTAVSFIPFCNLNVYKGKLKVEGPKNSRRNVDKIRVTTNPLNGLLCTHW